ncbi:MAG: hypothetical protein N3F04_07555 [Candidatus Nezhaarchaeota archaeon]|nr:hypothetical protein [Candidatus Nezhaarchaeota archaeon]MCX8142601.1 hypothetical protein [Candidatus Nezhaarchaeota archaeon]
MHKLSTLLLLFLLLSVVLPIEIGDVVYATPLKNKTPTIEIPREWIGKDKVVEEVGDYIKITYIHYAKPAKDSVSAKASLGDVDGDGARDGYRLLGYKWNLAKYPNGIRYIINPRYPTQMLNLPEGIVLHEVKASFEVWDIAVDLAGYNIDKLVYEGSYNIKYNIELFAEPTIDYSVEVNLRVPDGNFVVTWAYLSDSKVIAVTYLWITKAAREIVEFDMVLNAHYVWGIADGNEGTLDLQGKMDIRNIVTHEVGHVIGLNDLYDGRLWAMTMYGYGSYGEEIKRSLEPGDIAGAQTIYKDYRK